MKKYIYITIIFLIFLLFSLIITKDNNTVINILEPNMLQIDLNNNSKIDDNETICVANIETFTTKYKNKITDKSIEDHLALGYLAQEFANKTLLNKQVKIKFHKNNNPYCRKADIFINGEDYADLLYSKGFGSRNGTVIEEKIEENLEITDKLDLRLLNLKTNINHELYCEYGEKTENYIIIPNSQVPKNSQKCKICTTNKNNIIQNKKAPTTVSTGSIKLLLTDSITQLKPNCNCNSEVCTNLLKNINSAKKTIDIATYGWDYIPEIQEALENAKKRGVKIRLVYDSVSHSTEDYYKDKHYLINIVDEISSDSGDIRLMHNKFFIFDKKIVYTGSMNFSCTGLSGFNTNAVLIINSNEIADLYTSEFEQMLSGKFHDKKIVLNKTNKFYIDNSKVLILFSPYDKTSQHIIKYINNANKYIYVPAFVITHREITKALIEANKRGVDVKIMLDATSITSRNIKYKEFKNNNVPVKIENYAGKLHTKSMIIDDKYLVLGSMNFSFSGDSKNDENTLIIENNKMATMYRKFFEYFWQSIPDRWLHSYPGSETQNSIGACSDGVDNDHDGRIDMDDSSCRFTY